MAQEIVLILGFPASGKSTIAQQYIDAGYANLNRDKEGGTIDGLVQKIDPLLAAGKSIVMDNLFPTVESRSKVLAQAKKHNVPVHCVCLNTSLEDAQFNACLRMIDRVGKILDPKEKTNDPNLFPVAVLYKYRKEYVPPTTAEGFASVKTEKFVRKYPSEWVNKAIILDYDGTLRDTKSGNKFPTSVDDIKILPGRVEVLKKFQEDGYKLLGVSNQSGIAKGDLTVQTAIDCFERTNQLLGLNIEYTFCPHKVPPISCYCRKPGCGLGVQLIKKHNLNPKECIMVGDMITDKSFAARCGFQYMDQEKFFKVSK